MQIDTVIFDIGGVLVNARHRGGIQKEFGVALGDDERAAWDCAKVGAISMDTYYERALHGTTLQGKSDEVRSIVQREFEQAQPWGAYPVLPKLHDAGYQVGILSDHVMEWVGPIIKNLRLHDYCKAILVSQTERRCKPEPELYHEVCARLDRSPSQCVFIDDVFANVEGFRKIGGHAVQFRSIGQLEEDLKGLGIYLHRE